MRGAVRLTAGLIILLVMLEPVMLLLNGGLEEMVALVKEVGDEATGEGLAGLSLSATDAEAAVRQGEAVWRAGWEPLIAAAYARLDEQLAREIRDRFGETATVRSEFTSDGALSEVKVSLSGPFTPKGTDASEIRRWLCDRLAVAESQVVVVREPSFPQETASEMEGAGIE